MDNKAMIIDMLNALKGCVSTDESSDMLMITTLREIKPDSFIFVIDEAIKALEV